MDKILAASYPAGVPAEIDPTRYRSLAQLLEEVVPPNLQIAMPTSAWTSYLTYAELDKMSQGLRRLAAEAAACRKARAWRS